MIGDTGSFDLPDAPTAGVAVKSDGRSCSCGEEKTGLGAGGVVQSQARLSSPVVWGHRSEQK